MIRKLLLDAAAAGLALMVFALFHHVLPRAQQSLNVQTIRPVQAEETAVPETEEVRTAEAKAEDRTAAAEPETDETASAPAAASAPDAAPAASAKRGNGVLYGKNRLPALAPAAAALPAPALASAGCAGHASLAPACLLPTPGRT